MKYLFTLTLVVFYSLFATVLQGQILISPITINLPANPPANTADWASTMPPVMILAQSKLQNGQVNGIVLESKILVTIKSNGSKVCGSYTPQTAPNAGFNSITKNWSGAAVLNLLGQPCTLQPGSYELCVQFYGPSATSASVLIGESCKPFTIADIRPTATAQNYSPPQNLSPENEKKFKETEVKGAITFRWTPVVPRPKETVTYRLKVWQLMQGQNGSQAMRSNQPIVTKDVDNITQAVVTNIYTGPCKPPYLCDYVWNVEAVGKEGPQGGAKNYGTSEPTSFKIVVDESNPGTCLKLDTLKYTIVCIGQDADGKYRYKVQNLFINKVAGNTDPFMESGTTMSNINYVTAILPVGVLVQNITPTSFTGITASVSPAISFEFVSTTALTTFTANLAAYTYHLSAAGSKIYCQKNFEMTFDVPSCRCNLCDSNVVKWTLPQTIGYNFTNNQATLIGPIGFGPYPIVKLSAEVIDFYWYTEGDCKKCNTNDYYFGNLTSGSIGSMLGGTSIAGPGGTPIPTSHELDFISSTLSGVSLNSNINLNLSLPPQTTLSCCTDCFRFCIRYTATFMQNGVCKTCSIVKCYETKRKHRKIMMPFPPINECGEQGGIIKDAKDLPQIKSN